MRLIKIITAAVVLLAVPAHASTTTVGQITRVYPRQGSRFAGSSISLLHRARRWLQPC